MAQDLSQPHFGKPRWRETAFFVFFTLKQGEANLGLFRRFLRALTLPGDDHLFPDALTAPGTADMDQTERDNADAAHYFADLVQHADRQGPSAIAPYAEHLKLKQSGQSAQAANLGFTASGLAALGIDREMISTFPETFTEGMAERAEPLGDTGASAPEYWHGALGKADVHGVFILEGLPQQEAHNATLRARVRGWVERFNHHDRGAREAIAPVGDALGMTIRHIEFGETPYVVEDDKVVYPNGDIPGFRLEHFGFRDGISQPRTKTKNAGEPYSPSKSPTEREWDEPIASGEFFLGEDHKDELGNTLSQPFNKALREGGTFMVFRKLEQDVAAFRAYLKTAYPGDAARQNRLQADMMGRWQNGAPLIKFSDGEPATPPADYNDLNQFMLEGDDPHGLKCPMGAHMRRANPRDLHHAASRRHRVLRRGMAYGGPLLPDGTTEHDGQDRGLLFVALAARLDLQFEVMQRDWIARGDIFGQSGLGKCPVIGTHTGSDGDWFQDSQSPGGVAGLPAFVTMRGGDYFFAPGVNALQAMARGDSFAERDGVPNGIFDLCKPTETLMSIDDQNSMADEIMSDPAKSVLTREYAQRPVLPDGSAGPVSTGRVHVMARHADIQAIMGDEARFASSRYTRVGHKLIGEPILMLGLPASDPRRQARWALLASAMNKVSWDWGSRNDFQQAAFMAGSFALQLARSRERFKIGEHFTFPATYMIVQKTMGYEGPPEVPNGPDKFSELMDRIKLGYTHERYLGEWRNFLAENEEPLPPMAQPIRGAVIGHAVGMAALFANFQNDAVFLGLAGQVMSELVAKNKELLARERARRDAGEPPGDHLIGGLIDVERSGQLPSGLGDFDTEAALILIEMVATTMVVTGSATQQAIYWLASHGHDIAADIAGLTDDELANYGREAMRLASPTPQIFRTAIADTTYKGADIKKGDLLSLLTFQGNRDPATFPAPDAFDPTRTNLEQCFDFGVFGGPHRCTGEFIGLGIVNGLLRALAAAGGVDGVAGPDGRYERGNPAAADALVRFRQPASSAIA